MGRNGYEVEHYCEPRNETFYYMLVFGSLFICRYCGKELNMAKYFENRRYCDKGGHLERSLANKKTIWKNQS